MLAWAEHEFRLGQRLEDGASQRDHLESAARQLKASGRGPKVDPVPDGPPFPDELDYLWAWFDEISLGIAITGMAPPVVTWVDLIAWQTTTGIITLEGWEARTLVMLGALRAGISAEKTKAEAKQPRPKTRQPGKSRK